MKHLSRCVLLGLVIAVALASVGCGTSSRLSGRADVDDYSVSATANAESEDPATGGFDADEIDAELNAMQGELKSMDMPEDADFDGIETALY